MASCPFVSTWLCLAMQPFKIPYDPSLLIHAKTTARVSVIILAIPWKNVKISFLNFLIKGYVYDKLQILIYFSGSKS